MARIEYINGPVLGVGTLTLVPVDGKTRATYRWRIRPKGHLVRFSSTLNPGPIADVHPIGGRDEKRPLAPARDV